MKIDQIRKTYGYVCPRSLSSSRYSRNEYGHGYRFNI